jgi:uncharacterized protein (DUF2236 family)
VAELRGFIDGTRPELRAGSQARQAVRFLLVPPLPLLARGPLAVIAAAAVGLLPRWARGALWLPSPPGADLLVVRPAGLALLRLVGWALAPGARRNRPEPTSGSAGPAATVSAHA